MAERIPHIAVIGAGASGTLTAIHLLQKLKQPAVVYLVEKAETKLYRGAAYSSTLFYEPLNVPLAKMSAYALTPDSFFDWVKQHRNADALKTDFVSRRWYGDYLTAQLYEAQANVAEGVKFETVIGEVTDISKQKERNYELLLENGETLQADFLVFATGNELPGEIISKEEKELLGKNYVANSWTVNPFEHLAPNDSVLIIGTGLSMIDLAVSLKKQNHQGKIYALSRNGLLPKPHGNAPVYQLSKDVLSEDIEQLYQNILSEIELAKQSNIGWISVLDALRPQSVNIWKTLSKESKKLFLQKYRNRWDIHRHRIPASSAVEIEAMIKQGQFEVLTGSVSKVERTGEAFSVQYNTASVVLVNYVINCTGPSGDYTKTGNTLLKNLIAKGMMKQDELLIGIETGEAGEILKQGNTPLQNAFAVGPLRKANEWESIAIAEIRVHAEQTAQAILCLMA